MDEVEVDGVEPEPLEAAGERLARLRRSRARCSEHFVVTKTSSRPRPEARIACPTPASLRYAAAVSMWR